MLTAAEQQELAELEALEGASVQKPEGSIAGSAAKGVAETLALPAEAALGLAKLGANVAGADTSGIDALDPSNSLKSLLNSIGLETTPEESFAGNAAEAIAGGMTGLGAASRAKGILTPTANRLMQGRLGTFAAEDIAASAGGAGLKTMGQDSGQPDSAANALELAGNILTGYTASKFTGPVKLYAEGKAAYAKRKQAGMNQASEVVKGSVLAAGEDPAALVKTLMEDQGLGSDMLTSGAKSRSTALQSMERSLLNSSGNAAFADEYIRRGQTFNDFVRDSVRTQLGGESVPDEFVDSYLNSVEYASNLAEKSLQEATQRAAQEISTLPPIEGLDLGKEVRTRLESVYDDLSKVEDEAWAAVPDATVIAKDSPLDSALKSVLDEGEPDPSKLPPNWAIGAIEKFAEKGMVDAKEVQALRSSLMDSSRQASAIGQKNLARRLNVLADGALETLNRAESSYPEQLEKARGITREFKQRFSNDVISPILARSRSGGDKVADNETMERLFTSGEKGRTNFTALKSAFGEVPLEARSYVLQQFNRKVMPDGVINTKKAKDFLDKYRPVLEEADLVDTVDSFIKYGEKVDGAQTAILALHNSTAKDAAAKVITGPNTTGDQLVTRVSQLINNPSSGISDQLSDLFRTATDINAVEGLKTAVAEGAIRSIYTAGKDISANAPDRVKRLVKALEITGQYSEDQIKNFSQIADAAYRQSQANKAQIFKGQSNTAQDTMRANALSKLLSFTMLNVASKIKPDGPGSLKLASDMSDFGKRIGKKISGEGSQELINQAIFDKELMAALLENPNTMTESSRSKIRSVLKAVGKYTVGGAVQPSQAQIYGDDDGE